MLLLIFYLLFKMKTYDHQRKILEADPKKCLLALGTGTGKTLLGLSLAEGSTLIVTPKQQREDLTWQKNAEKFGIICNMKVISKEDLRRDWSTLPAFDTVILDESHFFVGCLPETRQKKGVLFPKTSQIFEALYNFLLKHPPKRLYLLSATPVPKPMALWGIAKLFGYDWDFWQFRAKYYNEIRMGQRRIWIAKTDKATKDKMAEIIKKLGYTGTIGDFTDLPPQIDKTVYIDLTEAQKQGIKDMVAIEADPLVRRSRMRTIENGVLYSKKVEQGLGKVDIMSKETIIFPSKKIDYILERAQEFKKLLIFANYTAQIEAIAGALRKEGYKVSTLTGSTKDRATVIQEAEKADECILIAQSSVSSGWEFPSANCTIFASLSWRFVDHEQSRGRTLRMNHIKSNLYLYLVIKGGVDEDCFKAIQSGKDFMERLTINI